MRCALPAVVLMGLVLSGCAAALVYDRDRPPADCRDQSQHCLHTGSSVGVTGRPLAARPGPLTVSSCPVKSYRTSM